MPPAVLPSELPPVPKDGFKLRRFLVTEGSKSTASEQRLEILNKYQHVWHLVMFDACKCLALLKTQRDAIKTAPFYIAWFCFYTGGFCFEDKPMV